MKGLVFILILKWAVGLHLDRSLWLSDAVVDACSWHNTRRVSLHTCWNQGVMMRVAKHLQQNILLQSWNIDVLHLPETANEVIVVDLDCTDSQTLLTQASHSRKFTLQNLWLLFSSTLGNVTEGWPDSGVLEFYPWLNNFNIFPDSEVYLITEEETEPVMLYRVGRDSPIKTIPRGRDRSDLQRTKLVAASVLFHTEHFKGFLSNFMPDVDTWPKLHYPIVVHLADQLNFSLELWAVNDYGWEVNGSFTGLMGQLQRREIDFAATGFFMRSDRIRVVEFTAETYHIRTTMLFRQPSLSSVSNIFILPFSSEVWICCLAYSIIVILIFIFELVVTRRFGITYIALERASFMDLVTLVLGVLCQQGSHVIPDKLSGRISLFCLSLTALFFYTSYSANIVALLQSPSSAIATLSDVLESPLAVGIQDLQYNRIYFKESTEQVIRQLYEKKVEPLGEHAYYKPEEGIRNVRNSLFAFNVETNLGYKIISEMFLDTEKCALSEIQLFPMPTLSLPVTKRSGYRDLFTRKVRWQRETGILHRNGKLWLPQKPQCEDVRGGTGFVSVGLKEFLPALKVLFYGMTLSIALLLSEMTFHHRKRKLGSR